MAAKRAGIGRAAVVEASPAGSGAAVDAPTDRRVDRRAFLGRMTALTAAATAGTAGVWTAPLVAREAGAIATGGGGPRPAPTGSGLPGQAARPLPVAPLPRPAQLPADTVDLTLAEAAALIRDRELSPVELVEAYLERISALDPLYMAFNTVVGEQALERARRLEGAPPEGALHGVPVVLKDNYYTAGIPTTANSHIFQDFVPEYDATAWVRLRAAGTILLGKTQMGPLATTRATEPDGGSTTINAWTPGNPSVSPGGSSSGTATAVAGRMAASGTGTQTGGSITNPAEAQGLTGIKPTMGRVSLRGIIPLTYTRDHPGPIARDALDAALMLQAMAGPDPLDPRSLGLPEVADLVAAATPVERGGRPALRWPTRIGVVPGYTEGGGGRGGGAGGGGGLQQTARQEMLRTFEGLGAELVEIELPEDWGTLTGGSFNNVRLVERTEPFLPYLREDVRLFGVSLSSWINGLLLGGAEYLHGQRAKLLLLRRVLEDVFAQCDVVVQTGPVPFDIIGLPLIAFPIGMNETADQARPVGAVLGGQPYAEDRLLSLAAAYQSVTDWHRRRPPEPDPDVLRQSTAPPGAGGFDEGGAYGRGRIDVLDVMELSE